MGRRQTGSGRGSGRRSSRRRSSVLAPVGLVALGLGLVIGIGYALRNTPVGEFLGVADPPAGQETEQTVQPGPAPGQGAQTAPTGGPDASVPAATEPGEAQKDPSGAKPGETKPAEQEFEPAAAAPAEESEAQALADSDAAALNQARARIDRAGGAADTMLITVYYTDGLGGGGILQPVQVRVPRSASRIYVTTEQVLNPPTDLALYSGAPSGTQIRGVNANGGVAIVDLSSEMGTLQGSAAAESFMTSLVYSLTEIPGIDAVELRIEGWPAELHGAQWGGPLTRSGVQAATGVQVAPVIEFGSNP